MSVACDAMTREQCGSWGVDALLVTVLTRGLWFQVCFSSVFQVSSFKCGYRYHMYRVPGTRTRSIAGRTGGNSIFKVLITVQLDNNSYYYKIIKLPVSDSPAWTTTV